MITAELGDSARPENLGIGLDVIAPEVVVALEQACRRVVSARIRNTADRDDLTQEAVVRSLAARVRITDLALIPYGVTVARNLCVEHLKSAQREASKLHLFFERSSPEDPVTAVQQQQERAAVVAAIATLRAGDRQLLLDHVLRDQPLSTSSARTSQTPGARAARLARGRAQARVEYVLALRGLSLPSAGCRQVLVAISAADKRRQDALDVPAHLAECPVCPTLIEPLARRQSALAGLLPLPLVLGLAKFTAATRNPPVRAATAAGLALVVAGGITAVAVQHPRSSATAVNSTSPGRRGTTVAAPPSAGLGAGAAPSGADSSPAPQAVATSVRAEPSVSALPTPATASTTPPATGTTPGAALGVCYFAAGSASLSRADLTTISGVARLSTARHLTELTVTGMTDATGDPTANPALAARRAATVAAALRSRTHVRVITAISAGKEATSVARPADRRAVIS